MSRSNATILLCSYESFKQLNKMEMASSVKTSTTSKPFALVDAEKKKKTKQRNYSRTISPSSKN